MIASTSAGKTLYPEALIMSCLRSAMVTRWSYYRRRSRSIDVGS